MVSQGRHTQFGGNVIINVLYIINSCKFNDLYIYIEVAKLAFTWALIK